MPALKMGPVEWGLLITLSLLWGGSFFFAEVALNDLPPFTVVAGRVALGAAVLLAVVTATGHRMPASAGIWLSFFIMGALNNTIPFTLIVWGQQYIESGLASILNATTPIFTVLVAHLLTADEKLTGPRLAGVGLGLCGVVLLIGPEALSGLSAAGLGQLAVLAAALSYAFAGVFGRRLRSLPTTVAAAGMVTASAVTMIPLALWLEQPWSLRPGPGAIAAVLGIAVLSTACAYLIYFRILAVAGATNLLLVTFLIPVSALLLGTAFLDEQPSWSAYAGMAVIFAGLAAIDGRLFKSFGAGAKSKQGA